MAAQQSQNIVINLGPLVEYLRQGGQLWSIESYMQAIGAKRIVEAVGVERFWAEVSPQQREEFRRLARQDEPPAP